MIESSLQMRKLYHKIILCGYSTILHKGLKFKEHTEVANVLSDSLQSLKSCVFVA